MLECLPQAKITEFGTYQAKVRKEKVQELVHSLDLKQDLACYRMIRFPDLSTIHKGIDGREESTVQPTTTLRDKLRNGVYTCQYDNTRDLGE